MGKYNNGILGGFNGKVGNVVGGTWKGISYMRAIQNTGNKKATPRQLVQRSKFAFAVRFLQPLYPVINIGFKTQAIQKTPRNAALSALINYAIEGEYPDFTVNMNYLQLAMGSLPVSASYSVQLIDGQIQFIWSDSEANISLYGTNAVMLVALAADSYPVYSIGNTNRQAGNGSLTLPQLASGAQVYCYMAFYNAEQSQVSNSVLVGVITAP